METERAESQPTAKAAPRRLAVGSFVALLLLLVAATEIAARFITARSANPELQRVVRDYGRLAQQGSEWIRFVPDAELSYALRPNFELADANGGGITRHNAEGFRNNSDFTPKSPDVLRIACYGASTTYGVGVGDNRDTYPAQLEEILNNTYRPLGWERVEVWNLGVGGYTSREILGTVKRTLPILKPDVVLIQNAINDVIPRFYPDYSEDYDHFRIDFTPLEVSAFDQIAYRSHAWLTLAYGLGWIRPLSLQSQTQIPMPPVDEALVNLELNRPTGFETNLEAAVQLAKDAGCQVWLLTQTYFESPEFAGPNEASRRLEGGYRRGLHEHTGIVIDVADRNGAGLIRLDEDMPRQRAYFTDPIHMSVEGNRIKAEIVAKVIAASLNREATQ